MKQTNEQTKKKMNQSEDKQEERLEIDMRNNKTTYLNMNDANYIEAPKYYP